MIPCKTCGQHATGEDIRCDTCREVESHLDEYLQSQNGRDFVRKRMPTLDNWPDWDYEAVLSKHEITVEQTDEYWWNMSWRYGGNGFNVDDEVIARQVSALFAELFLRNFSASFADNVTHGYAMWLELQDQRYKFELTPDLATAVFKMEGLDNRSDILSGPEKEAWDDLVAFAGVAE
jgi:hypothetical protein